MLVTLPLNTSLDCGLPAVWWMASPSLGTAWEVYRFIGQRDGKWPDYETLFTSPDVFEDEEDAKRDAVQKLKPLICCHESPFRMASRTAIDWIVDEH